MALLVPNAAETELLAKLLYGKGGSITAATNASPSVITSNAHGLSNGNSVNITDATGNTAINGSNLIVAAVATNTFQVSTYATSTTMTAVNGNGVFSGTAFWSLGGVEGATLKLFSSATTPAETDTAGTYTELSAGNGYSAKTLNGKLSTSAGWTAPASGAPTSSWSAEAAVAESTYVQQSWSFTGSFTINGYFIVGANSTTIWWAENFGSTKNITSGDSLTMTPRIGLA